MAFLTQLASIIMNSPLLAGIFATDTTKEELKAAKMEWLYPVIQFIDSAFIPILIILGAVGGVWCIFLGVNLARAETADKADEAKKRLINVIIAIIATALLIFLLALFVTKGVPAIFSEAKPPKTTTTT